MHFSYCTLLSLLCLAAASKADRQLHPLLTTRTKLANPSTTCSKLASSLKLPNTTIFTSTYLAANTNITLPSDASTATCAYGSILTPVDLCRVSMNVATSNRSGIYMEAWLPTNWTGRFLSTGNGGLAGCLQYTDFSYAASLGFATVGANGGKNGTGGEPFFNNPDTIHDFASRSVHTGVTIGKALTDSYYGTPHKKSYYLGCSTGGRQGFKSAQAFPDDFDGIVAGAPAVDFPQLTSWSATFYTYFGDENSTSFIPPGAAWAAIHQEILNQCDSIDGVVDEIIEDPSLCNFRPEALLCPSASNSASTNTTAICFSKPQVKALRKTFTDYYGLKGELIFPRMQPGSEEVAQFVYYTTGPFPYSVDWFRYVVYNDPSYDISKYTRKDAEAAIAQNPFNIQSFDGDLSNFQQKGGKILHYHGQADYIITSPNSNRYYDHVSRTMDLPSSEIDSFYRFFRVSGMGHCGGGNGAINIGNSGSAVSTLDPQDNVLLRMVAWVEQGASQAPESITGTAYVNGDPTQGVDLVRNHCKYPTRNVCVDPANYKSAAAWKCV